MEKTILNQNVSLDTAPVHVAPGGSVMFSLSGNAANIASLLVALREEIAYGMADIRTIDAAAKTVEASIYTGKADIADLDAVMAAHAQNITSERSEIAEGAEMTGLSMRARNQVIDCLSK